MPIIIFKVKNYRNEGAIENLVNYIMKSPYLENMGSDGCFFYPNQNVTEGVLNSFNAVKQVYYKCDSQLVQHVILGLSDIKRITESEATMIAKWASHYFIMKGYQVFWGIHFSSDRGYNYRHIHMAVNTVNGMTGLRYSASNTNMNDMKTYLKNIYPEYSWSFQESESFYYEII